VHTSASVMISPNPARHMARLTVAPGISVESVSLCDASGKVIERRTANWQEWNIEKLAAGSYMFIVTEKDGTRMVQKLSVTD